MMTHRGMCRENERRVREAALPVPGVPPLSFKTSYATPLFQQYLLILAKNSITYWRCVACT